MKWIKRFFKMNNWSILQKNDKLYLLVPVEENNIVKYQFQESYVINIKSNKYGCTIRFKYTDSTNHRRRMEQLIYTKDIDKPYIFVSKSRFPLKNEWGQIVMCYSNPEQLNTIYFELIKQKQEEIQAIIKKQQTYLKTLENIKYEKMV